MAPTVDLSSCEGETSTVVEAAKKVIYFRSILEEMHLGQVEPTPVYNDNQSMLTVATKPSGHHRRIKYMLPKINWLIQQSRDKIIQLLYMRSQDLPPDLGTKRFSGTPLQVLRKRVMGL